jgi:hypothetical protein
VRPRAIKDLTQLDDDTFLAAIAEGLRLILSHVERLLDAALISPGKPRHPAAAKILLQFAQEEASKFFDFNRCGTLR